MQDFSKFRLRVNIKSTIKDVYRAWATTTGLESWFLSKADFKSQEGVPKEPSDFIQPSDTYVWNWFGHSDDVREKGAILKANGVDTFAFTFSLGCPVSISIFRDGDEVICELVESDLPVENGEGLQHFVGDSRGWIFYLTNLKSVLEGGLDLRNKNEALKNVITA